MRTYFLSYRNGDFHCARSFIRDIISKYKSDEYFYYSVLPFIGQPDIPHVLSDIDGLQKIAPYRRNVPPCSIGAETIINVHPNAYGGITSKNTSFDLLYRNFEKHYKILGIQIETMQHYLPTIDFSKCRTDLVDLFVKGLGDRKKILVANNVVLSGQSHNFDFGPIISEVAIRNKDVAIILTNRDGSEVKLPNVTYFSGLIDGCDLNEVAYLSKYCEIIVGRSSGPYTFSMIKDNLMDSSKTFVCFCAGSAVAHWYSGMLASVKWSNKYDSDNLVSIVDRAIKND